MLADQFRYGLDGLFADTMESPGRLAPMARVDHVERNAEFSGNKPAVAAARAPADRVRLQDDRPPAVLGDLERGR